MGELWFLGVFSPFSFFVVTLWLAGWLAGFRHHLTFGPCCPQVPATVPTFARVTVGILNGDADLYINPFDPAT
jgi:hypothetical protein